MTPTETADLILAEAIAEAKIPTLEKWDEDPNQLLKLKERILSKLEFKSNGCVEWKGYKRMGYGQISFRDKLSSVHRLTYQLYVGKIPVGQNALHHCDNPSCCNPAHIFLGSQKDNSTDCVLKGRHSEVRKTHCKNGHPFLPEYEEIGTAGRIWRRCKICRRDSERKRKRAYENGKRITLSNEAIERMRK